MPLFNCILVAKPFFISFTNNILDSKMRVSCLQGPELGLRRKNSKLNWSKYFFPFFKISLLGLEEVVQLVNRI